MTEEKGWAEFYEQHRDDPDIWGEPEESVRPVPKQGLSVTITVRFSPDEASEIRKVAKNLNVSYSTIIRSAVRMFVHTVTASGYGLHPLTPREGLAETGEESPPREYSLSNAQTSTGQLTPA